MQDKPPIILTNRLYIPSELVADSQLEPWHYSWKEVVFEPELDELGENVVDDQGKPILAKNETLRVMSTYNEIFTKDGTAYITLPRGDFGKLTQFIAKGYQDRRPIRPLGFHIKMAPSTMQDHRWPDQRRCVEEYLKYGYGIIKGDTGSGKTVIGVAAIARMGMTTLLVSTMTGGIAQWIEEIRTHSNISELEEQHGPIIGPYKSGMAKPFLITVSTVQAFLHEGGREFLQRYRDFFGLLLVDEVHTVASPKYSKVVQFMNPFAYLGLTATVERKDMRHKLLFDIVGPVVAEGTAHQMPPTVTFVSTGITAPLWIERKVKWREVKWNYVLKYLAESEDRQNLIKKFVYEDIDDKRVVACISERRIFAQTLHKQLEQDGYRTVYVDGKTPVKVRDRIYKEFKEGKYQVICAGKVLNALINLPNLDCIHLLTPSNSPETAKQIYGRSRREVAGKRNPIIRYYVDEGGQLDGCYKTQKRLCKDNGWDTQIIGTGSAMMTGLSVWKKRRSQHG